MFGKMLLEQFDSNTVIRVVLSILVDISNKVLVDMGNFVVVMDGPEVNILRGDKRAHQAEDHKG